MNDSECLAEFRVKKRDLQILAEALQIPDSFTCYQRSVVSGMEGLCILLRRLAYPCRYSDIITRFGLPVPVLSMVCNDVLDFVYDTHGHRITQWNPTVLSPDYLQIYSDAVAAKGAALHDCFGFIDGTVRPICRPGEQQRILYNRHKRLHSLKFQAVVLPNGLIGNLFRPVEGRRHDAGMLADSRLLDQLQLFAHSPLGNPFCLYGDPAYPLRIHLQAPFRDRALTPLMVDFNKSMSTVRESVEWLFNDIATYFKYIDFKKNLKIGLSSVGKMYVVCALLRNALTCLYGNQTSTFFELDPPSLQEYFL
ncbi:uncharacterized protein [Montipora foliosa]|uniref:uncharacterized protein n=1 Tax=Montipora foliosa TaxID=591990 RepID=UPI0035F20B4C